MSKLTFILILILPLSLCAQEFSFTMHFEDAVGHKDSIVVGYDKNAKYGPDSAFNEKNIITQPWDTTLDVRISDEWRKRWYHDKGTFHLKKEIFNIHCHSPYNLVGINILTKHWPIMASWDNKLFRDDCNIASYFSSIYLDGDVGYKGKSNFYSQEFQDTPSLTFNSNYTQQIGGKYSGFINEQGDTISNFWLLINSDKIEKTSDETNFNEALTISPNPSSDLIHLEASPDFGKLKSVSIHSITGQKMITSKTTDLVDISSLNPGLYILIAFNERGNNITSKLVKK